jgi:HAD superfamily hydrolase (TIGR01490 family)
MAGERGAAFYDVDGTIIKTNVVHAFAFYSLNSGSLLDSAKRFATTVAGLPFFWALDKYSRKAFNDVFYLMYKGLSEDRLVMLSEELFEKIIQPSIYPGAVDLIQKSRAAGNRQVIVSGALDFTVRPLAKYLGVDDLIANRMEFNKGYATGKVIKPLLAGAQKAVAIRDYCERHHLSLNQCSAYSDSYSDYVMLAVVGRPAAVNPDLRLKNLAKSHEWPIINLS